MACLGERYGLSRVIGAGGQAEVWAAQDRVLGREVAVKWFHAGCSAQAALAELRRHQALRNPTLAELLDHGEAEGRPYLVMELVHGAPFCEAGVRLPWRALSDRLARLLSALDGLHGEGLVHRDLKPANVLVTPSGAVKLLDLGLVEDRGETAGPRRGVAGTPPYVAPELWLSLPATARVDLFAAGVMAFEALAGQLPWPDPGRGPLAWATSVQRDPPLRLRPLCSDAPDALIALIEALMHPSPAARPASAAEALESLGRVAPLSPLPLPPGDPLSLEQLQGLFAGPSLLLHLPEDGAAELYRRTGGARALVAAELLRWELDGLAAREGDQLRLTRADIARLAAARGRRLIATGAAELPADLDPDARDLLAWISLAWPEATTARLATWVGLTEVEVDGLLHDLEARGLARRVGEVGWEASQGAAALAGWRTNERLGAHARIARALPAGEGRVHHWIAADQLGQAADDAVAHALALADDGQLDAALGLLDQVARWMHDERDTGRERAALRALALVALWSESVTPLRLAAWALDRAREPAGIEGPRALVRAALSSLRGEAVEARTLLSQAARDLDAMGEGGSPDAEKLARAFDVQRWTWAARVSDLEGQRSLKDLIEDRRDWARDDPDRHARWLGWGGWMSYRRARYMEAAALHRAAGARKREALGQISSMLNESMALLEGGLHAEAERVAALACEQASARRFTFYELQARWILRSAAYRAGRATTCDEALIAAVTRAEVRPASGLALLTEAAIAWRASAPRAVVLAEDASARLDAVNARAAATLGRALAWRAAGNRSLSEAVELYAALATRTPAGVRLQILALLAPAIPDAAAQVRACASQLPGWSLARRLEVLSLTEALQFVGWASQNPWLTPLD